ncbi:MAG TPA: extracellular solute-binding protein [Hypericibacter adhaerens]|jgi:spermidine/putrescine-binding protein|uniref:Spermidine/putrescine ABC transporter n=1 Tax=Hypericibacter adhaerens TaxID=2602016 RepID=A0A5J6MWQ0_9PROT|nr:extracellular solute-binding protein [Hypericibacter adhaerens]QEX22152.1 spermidine/putrescine ABC transporter [Hypericibacter adhaerens]HWA43258.1 extracellular solute-binding protein [Hypericibacter adhaerens]
MDGKKFAERLLKRELSRRDIQAGLAKMGLGVAAMSMLPSAAKAAPPKLTVYEWAGYDVPDLHQSYIKKYGGSPDFPLFASEEEALQKIVSGFKVDLAHPCSYNVKRWREAKILEPIDTSRIPNYVDIWPKFKEIPQTQADGKTWFVPFDCGNSSILYRTDLVAPEDVKDPSWSLLFNEKYKGRLAMYNTDTTLIEIAARVLGMKNFNSLSDEELEKVKPLLKKQREVLRFYWDDATQIEQALASGELVAAYAWNGSVKVLKDQGVPVEYMVPKEGILTWVCGLVRVTGGQGDEQAGYDFIDSMLSPESGVFQISTGYGHSNRKSYEMTDPKVLAALGFDNPEEKFARADVSDEADEPYRSKYIALVNDIKAGVN